HPFGDRILVQFAGVLKDSLRNIDIVARFGGEEFMALLPETDCAAGYSVAERIRKSVEEHVFGDEETPVKLTTSIGVLPVPPDSENFQECIEKVDKPLYRAKQCGRNCVKVYGKD
ncbi:MAG: GGDEF domain-containing protein, partial [bacterium]